MTGHTPAEIAEAHRRWEERKLMSRMDPARLFMRDHLVSKIEAVRQDQIIGIRARRPGGLESYETRAAMRAAQNLASARKRRDRRGQRHGRPAPRGVTFVQAGVGFPLAMPNYGRALQGLSETFRRMGVAALAATDTFADIRERVVLQQARGGFTANVEIEDEMPFVCGQGIEGEGNAPLLELVDDTHTGVTRETLMDVMQREC